jgi:hypothetical protein
MTTVRWSARTAVSITGRPVTDDEDLSSLRTGGNGLPAVAGIKRGKNMGKSMRHQVGSSAPVFLPENSGPALRLRRFISRCGFLALMHSEVRVRGEIGWS